MRREPSLWIYFLRWAHNWGGLVDCLVGILTLGFYRPRLGLATAKVLCMARVKAQAKP